MVFNIKFFYAKRLSPSLEMLIMITVDELKTAIMQRVDVYNQTDYPLNNRPTLTIPLSQSLNHILAQDVFAAFDIPRQNLSAMDGFAIAKGSNLDKDSRLKVIGESQAGLAFQGTLTSGQAIRIFTGAVVPKGCDTVVMQENTNFDDVKQNLDKTQPYAITLTKTANQHDNIRRQGEEIRQQDLVLPQGKRINPADISLLANLGMAMVEVWQPLVVGIIATGDELVDIGHPLTQLSQIYNSNTPTLQAMLAHLPVQVKNFGIIPDDLEQTNAAIRHAISECDVLISTAGVSVGDYDFLTTAIEHLGKINHYKVAMKPGKPFVFGELHHQKQKTVLYFGLPGNPLSTVVGFLQFIKPALWQMSAVQTKDIPKPWQISAKLMNDVKKSVGRMDFQRGYLQQNATGEFLVEVFGSQQSHRIKQLSQANCLVVLAKESGNVSCGEMVTVQPFLW